MLDATPIAVALLAQGPNGVGGTWFGAYPALVTDIKDPDSQGRVKVRLPWAADTGGARYDVWARVATMMGGNNRGSWFIPDVDDEVLVVFEGGDPRRPYVIGALWNGRDAPPESMDGSGSNNRKVLRSRNGVKVTLDDESGKEQLILETPGGQKVTLKDGPGSLELVDSNGNSVKLQQSGITVTTSGKFSISASELEVSAGKVTVTAGMSQFNGTVKANTAIADTVVGTSYTPGAGNIW
jgi:uncharacterized protein involved in type VI secretion and phage assembly